MIYSSSLPLALFKTLAKFHEQGISTIHWNDLAKTYLDIYVDRLKKDPRPQQSNPFRRSVQEHIFYKLKLNKIKKNFIILFQITLEIQ